MPTAPKAQTELTIFKVGVDFKTQQPQVYSEQAIDKGGECYWSKSKMSGSAFGCLTRIPKYSVFTIQAVAIRHFVSMERAKAIELRRQADAMEATALAAEMLMASY